MQAEYKKCPKCGAAAAIDAAQCASCGRIYRTTAPIRQTQVIGISPVVPVKIAAPYDRLWIAAIAAAAALLIGCFMPIISVPAFEDTPAQMIGGGSRAQSIGSELGMEVSFAQQQSAERAKQLTAMVGGLNFVSTPEGGALLVASVCALGFAIYKFYGALGPLGFMSILMIFERFLVVLKVRSSNDSNSTVVLIQLQFGWLVLSASALALIICWSVSLKNGSAFGPLWRKGIPKPLAPTLSAVAAFIIVLVMWQIPDVVRRQKEPAPSEQSIGLENIRMPSYFPSAPTTIQAEADRQSQHATALEAQRDAELDRERRQASLIQQQNEERAKQLSGKGYVPDTLRRMGGGFGGGAFGGGGGGAPTDQGGSGSVRVDVPPSDQRVPLPPKRQRGSNDPEPPKRNSRDF